MSLLRRLLEEPQRVIPAVDGEKMVRDEAIARLHQYYSLFEQEGYVCTHAGHVVVPYQSSLGGQQLEVVSPFLFLQTPPEHQVFVEDPRRYTGGVLYADTGILERVKGGWVGLSFRLDEQRLLAHRKCSRWDVDAQPRIIEEDYGGTIPGRYFLGVLYADKNIHGIVYDPQVSVRDTVYDARKGLFVAHPLETSFRDGSLEENTEMLLKDA